MSRAKDLYLQGLRGLAITAVVLIHVLPQAEYTLLVRPLTNWAVALFLFLSGMLSPVSKVESKEWGGVTQRRLKKTLVPYAIWSVIYWVVLRGGSPLALAKGLLTGTCSAQMYYLLVYAQLVMLTPWLYRALRTHRWLMYSITPGILLLREVLGAFGYSIPYLGSLFVTWLIYYLIGLEWAMLSKRLQGVPLSRTLLTFLSALALQYASGFAWNGYGSFDMATTQLKISSMVTSLSFIAMVMRLHDAVPSRLSSRSLLTRLGDISFGIYLCHIAVLIVVRKVFAALGLTAFGWCFALWLGVLAISGCLVLLCQRIVPRRVLHALGFS